MEDHELDGQRLASKHSHFHSPKKANMGKVANTNTTPTCSKFGETGRMWNDLMNAVECYEEQLIFSACSLSPFVNDVYFWIRCIVGGAVPMLCIAINVQIPFISMVSNVKECPLGFEWIPFAHVSLCTCICIAYLFCQSTWWSHRPIEIRWNQLP